MARAMMTSAVVVAMAGGVLWMTNVGVSQHRKQPRIPGLDAIAAFDRVASVLQSPRCMNCHPRGDRPSQGDDRHVHLLNVQRGANDRGLPAMGCTTCHQEHNNDRAGVPGAPHWRLAPKSMGWTGLDRGELCRTLLDRTKNGGRNTAALLQHMTEDKIVLWAWHPGVGRTAPPISTDDLKRALQVWVSGGTPCPQ